MTSADRPVIAVFNSSNDTVEMLRTALEQEGFQTVVGHIPDLKKGELDLLSFIAQHDPGVIVYDISPPYEPNWAFLRLRPAFRDHHHEQVGAGQARRLDRGSRDHRQALRPRPGHRRRPGRRQRAGTPLVRPRDVPASRYRAPAGACWRLVKAMP